MPRQTEPRNHVKEFRSQSAEKSLLGAILLKNDVMSQVADIVEPEHFNWKAHEHIYGAMLSLWKARKPIDLTLLHVELGTKLEDAGGPRYLSTIIDDTPSSRNAKHYAVKVKELAQRRALSAAVHEALKAIHDPDMSLHDAAVEAEQILRPAMPKPDLVYSDTYGPSFQQWSEADTIRETSRVFTGIGPLDAIHIGGIPKGVTIVGGRTSSGKSSLLLTMAHNLGVTQGEPVQYVSGEMDTQEMTGRLVALHGRLDAERIISGQLDYVPRDLLRRAVDEVTRESRIAWLCKKATPSQIRASAYRQKSEYGLAALIIDYIGIMRPDPAMRKATKGERYLYLGEMMKAYKDIADELEIPVLVGAQLARKAVDKKKPTLEDLKESGSLEEDAAVVWLLHRLIGSSDGEINVAKNRNGRVGRVPLFFEGGCMRFSGADGAMDAAARAAAASANYDEGDL